MIPAILIIPVTIAILALSYLKFIIKKAIDSYDVPHQPTPERDPVIPKFNAKRCIRGRHYEQAENRSNPLKPSKVNG